MTITAISLFLAFLLGIGCYHIARTEVEARRIAAGGLPRQELFEDVAEDNRHTLGYLISGVAMGLGAVLTFNLVAPMGWTDYYALLLDGGIILFLAMGLTLIWIDAETKILPSKIIYAGGIGTLALFAAAAISRGGWELLIPMAIAGVFYFAFYGVIWFWAPRALGFGDVRLSFFIGAALGFLSIEAAFVGFALPWMLATLAVAIAWPFGTINSKSSIAFGPWMILGAFIALFWGRPIVAMIAP